MEAVVGLLLLLDPSCDVSDEVLHSATETETARSTANAAPVVERCGRNADQFGKFLGRDHVGDERILTVSGLVASVGGVNHRNSIETS